MAEFVEIVEVGPRDGLQNEKRIIPTAEKIALINLLSEAGFRRIEATSFVSVRWVPQMADAAEVMAGIRRTPGITYSVLTPNMRGYEAARLAGAGEVAIFAAASEGFSRANLNCSIAESIERFEPIAAAALADGLRLRGYVSTITHCPYDGRVPPAQVATVVARLRDLGCHDISLGETLGRAMPDDIDTLMPVVLNELAASRLAGHFHDTNGRALANIEVALSHGIRTFDASVGGLGGCPYAPGAAGNVATEAVADRLVALGFAVGLKRDVLQQAAAMARGMRNGTGDFDNG